MEGALGEQTSSPRARGQGLLEWICNGWVDTFSLRHRYLLRHEVLEALWADIPPSEECSLLRS